MSAVLRAYIYPSCLLAS